MRTYLAILLSTSLAACVAEVGAVDDTSDSGVTSNADAAALRRDLGPYSDAEPVMTGMDATMPARPDMGMMMMPPPDGGMMPPPPDGGRPPPPDGSMMMPPPDGGRPPPPDGSMMMPPPDGGSGGSCNPSCNPPDVCCTQGMCSGMCVPDCRMGPGCPNGMTCDQTSGVCIP